MDERLVSGVVDTQLASGAISANGRGNASLRVPSSDDMYFTTSPS
jgi:hypothetical protein